MKKITNNLISFLAVAALFLLFAFTSAKFGQLSIFLSIGLVAVIIIFAIIIKNPFWGLLGLVFFLPFERIPSIDIGVMNLKINQVFAGLTLIAWIMSLLFQKRKIQPNALTWPILLFLLVAYLSLFNSGYLPRSLLVLIFTIFTALASFVVVGLVDSKESLKKVTQIIFLSTVAVVIFALWQLIGDMAGLPNILTGLREAYTKAIFGLPRVQAFSNEPLYLANYLFIPIGLIISMFLGKQYLIKKSYLTLLLLVVLLIFLLTIARSAFLGLAVMLIFFLLMQAKRLLSWKNTYMVLTAVLIIGGGSMWFVSKSDSKIVSGLISHISLENFSVSESGIGRVQTYQKALEYWQESPLLGIGIGNFAMRSKNYPPAEEIKDWDIVNNEYLEILTEMGILGIIAFALIILVVFWRSTIAYFKTQDPFLKSVLLGLLGAFLAILVQYNFFSTLYIMHFWVLIGLIVAAQNLCFLSQKNNIEARRK